MIPRLSQGRSIIVLVKLALVNTIEQLGRSGPLRSHFGSRAAFCLHVFLFLGGLSGCHFLLDVSGRPAVSLDCCYSRVCLYLSQSLRVIDTVFLYLALARVCFCHF